MALKVIPSSFQKAISWIIRMFFFYLFSMKFFVHGLFPPPFFILSLLLGVDEDKKQIACGLVDTIGMFITTKEPFSVDTTN